MRGESMATTGTGCGHLHFLLGLLFLFWPEGGLSLELLPSASRVILPQGSNYSTVCSGWSDVSWALPGDAEVGVSVGGYGSSSVLSLTNATWRQSGRYTCSEKDSELSRSLDLFVPGDGPSQWLLPSPDAVVMRRSLSGLVPCVVSDPDLQVALWLRSGSERVLVTPVQFNPALGFTALLNDSSYVCSARRGQQVVLSQVYYVYSVIGPEQLLVDLQASAVVLRRGDPLMVNCTVSESESVYFSWSFPRKHYDKAEQVEPLTELLFNQIRSIINISESTEQDSGLYVCSVEESLQKQKFEKVLNITVLSRGFVDLSPSDSTLVQTLLHHTVTLSLHIRAFPAPNVTWSITMATGNRSVTPAIVNRTVTTSAAAATTTSASTTRLSHTRFLTVLRLEEVEMNQTGSYLATVSNDDDIKEVEFRLEVRVPPRILALSEVGVASVMCVCEGAPPPKLTWFICPPDLRCTDSGWRNISESISETSTEKDRVTEIHSVLTLKSLDSVSSVRCEVKNSVGRRAWDLRLVPPSLWSQVKVLAAVLVLVVLAVVFLILLIVVWTKKPVWTLGWRLLAFPPDGSVALVDPSDLPYDSGWDVPEEDISLGQVISSGTFGTLTEASVLGLTGTESSCRAIVLTAKGGAVRSLLSDLKTWIHIGRHMNVLQLLGACTKHGPLMVISEWCCHGDLPSYLKKHKVSCPSGSAHSVSDVYLDMSSDSQYVAMKQLCATEYTTLHNTTTDPQGALSAEDLLSFCFQMARALDFLSQRNVVHRDVAARNVLVSEQKILKLGDFGLSRDMRRSKEYERRGKARLPVKWMSPESIFLCVYTTQSDVWSYGVLLWEIYSMGDVPFPDVPQSHFFSDLKKGKRLNRPELAPEDISDLMTSCWDQTPGLRPSASALVQTVGNMMSQQFQQRFSSLEEKFLSEHPETRVQAEPGLNPETRNQTEPAGQGEEPQSTCPTPFDDITDSAVNLETRADSAQDAKVSADLRNMK